MHYRQFKILRYWSLMVMSVLLVVPMGQEVVGKEAGVSKRNVSKTKRKRVKPKRRALSNRKAIQTVNNLKRGDTLVLDLDNTLFDTRPRKLKVLKLFYKQHKKSLPSKTMRKLKNAKISDMKYGAEENIRQFRIPQKFQDSFRSFWVEKFWSADSLKYDRLFSRVSELVNAAEERGVTIKYLSGRYSVLHEASASQIRQAQLPLKNKSNLVLKTDKTITAKFKTDVLLQFPNDGKIVLLDDSFATVTSVQKLKSRKLEAIQVITTDKEAQPSRLPAFKKLFLD